jgi:hypothetical protein
MNINYVANGLGGQSMYLLYLASQKKIPATVAITADTGWENDCDMMDGTKTTAEEFYRNHVAPFGQKWGIHTSFVRTKIKDGSDLPSISDYLIEKNALGKDKAMPVPMFGSNGGRMKQTCTDKWKISAMKQECRRLGALTARSAQGIHFGERARRVKGKYIGNEDGWSIYQTEKYNKQTDTYTTIKWLSHYYPLVDLQMDREDVRREMDRLGLPYLISSECCGCPHADPWRWLRRTEETIESVAQIEDMYKGQVFFTDQRRPLREVIADLRLNKDAQASLFGDTADFSCTGGVCGV